MGGVPDPRRAEGVSLNAAHLESWPSPAHGSRARLHAGGRLRRRQRRQLQRHRHRSLGILGLGRDHRRPQRAHRRGARGRRQRRRPLRPDRPAAVHLHDHGHLPGLCAGRVHRRAAGRGAGVPARPDAPGRRGHRGRHGQGHRDGDGCQLGAHRRQRHRARSRQPPGQRPADVAADAAGAGLAELGHGHLERRPVQRPRQPAERDPLRRRGRLGDHRRGARQHQRRDPVAVQAAGQPRERAGVPGRVQQLPGRVRHRHRRPGQRHHQVGRQPALGLGVRVLPQRQSRRAQLLRQHPQRRRQRDPGAAQVAARPAPVRRLGRRADHEGPRVLLRQLRGLPARRGRQLRRGRAERVGVVAGRAGDCDAASGIRRAGCGAPGRRVIERGLRHLPAPGARDGRGELVQRPRRLQAVAELVVVRPRLPRQGYGPAARGNQRPRRAHHRRSDQRRVQPPGGDRPRADQRIQGRLQRGAVAHQRTRADGQRRRLLEPRHQPERIGRQHRHRRPGFELGHRRARRPGPRQQRDQRPRPALRSVLAVVRLQRDAGGR